MQTDNLKNRDYYLLIDKSGSMATKDCPGGKSRWQYCQETTKAIASRLQEYDPDGITVVAFASSHKMYENTTPEVVDKIFQENQPMGSTDLASALQSVYDNYNAAKKAGTTKPNGALCLVITDGVPDDEKAVQNGIVKFGNGLANGDAEFGIGFFQVGKDAEASAFLSRLDDGLTAVGAKHDIVDAKTFEEIEKIGLEEALVAALTD